MIGKHSASFLVANYKCLQRYSVHQNPLLLFYLVFTLNLPGKLCIGTNKKISIILWLLQIVTKNEFV